MCHWCNKTCQRNRWHSYLKCLFWSECPLIHCLNEKWMSLSWWGCDFPKSYCPFVVFNSEPYIVLLNCCDKSKCDNLKTINYSHTVNLKAGPIWNIIIGLWQQLLTRPVKSFTCDDIDWWNHQFIVRVCPCLQLFKLGQRLMWVTFTLKECERGMVNNYTRCSHEE